MPPIKQFATRVKLHPGILGIETGGISSGAASCRPMGCGALNETFFKLTESTVKAPNARMDTSNTQVLFSKKERMASTEILPLRL